MADDTFTRRSFLTGSLAAPLLIPALATSASKPRIAVVGAGAFGGWTALHLLRNGAQVTLIDSWGAGNSRASSGGETRVIRGVYGPTAIYTKWAARSFQLWREAEKTWNRKVYFKTHALWMVRGDDAYEKAAMPLLEKEGLKYETFTAAEATKRYPQINFEGIQWALWEEEAGFLLARQSCQLVLDTFISEGGEFLQKEVRPFTNTLEALHFSDGSQLKADGYVFACGPWLGLVFPDVLANLIHPTRQEVFYFGTPAGDLQFSEQKFPVWIDHGERLIYGIPGNERRGFKIADDTRGEPFDPTNGQRILTPAKLEEARKFIAMRFPALKDAPLVESRVCQYENSSDQNFIIDRHPNSENIWIVGGGSGHGFKHGPALGEYVASLVLGKQQPDPFFQLGRFKK
jgi:glycine/D-amino acid oxidase-like deaminating enzyme